MPQAASVEVRAFGRLLREPFLWLLLVVWFVLASAAYLVPYSYSLDIGGTPGGRIYDRPYLLYGFNIDPEYDVPDAPTTAFRWIGSEARLVFPGLGRATRIASLRIAAGQPVEQAVPGGWSLGSNPLLAIPVERAPRNYQVLLPADRSSLDLRWTAPTFQPPHDARQLGFAADTLRLVPISTTRPAPTPIVVLSICWLVAYLLMRHWGVGKWVALAILFCLIVVGAWLLAAERLVLTTFALRLLATLCVALVGTILLFPLLHSAARVLGVLASRTEVRAVVGLVMLAWIIRLGGLLHPQAYTSDLGLNINNLRGVIGGDLIFTEGLPSRAGGGQAPYPPAQYIMLMPGALVLNGQWLVQAGNTLADSLVIVSCWLLLRSAGMSGGVALFAGGLYLFATPLLRSLSIGEMANVWGQALIAPLVLLLFRWEVGKLQTLILLPALMIALLAHTGVLLSLLLFLGTYLLIRLLQREAWLKLAGVVFLAILLAIAVYYSAHATLLLNRSQSPRVPFSLGRLHDQLTYSFAFQGPLGPLDAILGLAGLVIVVRGLRSQQRGVLLALFVAWWCSTLASLGSLLWTQQAVRWHAFLFPSLALGGGISLDLLWRKQGNWRVLAYGLLALSVLRGAVLWYSQIATYQH